MIAVKKSAAVPGLLDGNLEIFWDQDKQRLLTIFQGSIVPFISLPKSILSQLEDKMHDNEDAVRIMERFGVCEPQDQVYLFYKCSCGGLNLSPDFELETGELNHEHWECGCSGHCCLRALFRGRVRVANGYLSEREISVIKELANFNPGKMAAARLLISEFTLDKHKSNIFQKTGFQSIQELLVWAYQIQLI